MRRRTKIMFALGALAVLLALGWVLFSGPGEPLYQGRKLSQWLLTQTIDQNTGMQNPVLAQEIDDAVRAIGTNAIPLLLDWIRYQTPRDNPISAVVNAALEGSDAGGPFNVRRQYALSWATVQGFVALGPAAAPAIPELIQCLHQTNSYDTVRRAARALLGLGPNARAQVFSALTNQNALLRHAAVSAFARVRFQDTNFVGAVPGLVLCLQDREELVAAGAAMTLGLLALEPDKVIPALTNALTERRQYVRHRAIGALGRYGPQASNALPALFQVFKTKDFDGRRQATNAIRRIDPNALPK